MRLPLGSILPLRLCFFGEIGWRQPSYGGAPDVWDSAAFSSIFLASGFSCSQTESTPSRQQVPITCSVKVFRKVKQSPRNDVVVRVSFSRGIFYSIVFLGNPSPPPT